MCYVGYGMSYYGNAIGLTVEDQVQSRILIMIMVTGTVISLEYENVLWVSWYSNMVFIYLCILCNYGICVNL